MEDTLETHLIPLGLHLHPGNAKHEKQSSCMGCSLMFLSEFGVNFLPSAPGTPLHASERAHVLSTYCSFTLCIGR